MKRKLPKPLALLLAAVLLCGLFPAPISGADAAPAVNLAVSSASVAAGDTYDVTLSADADFAAAEATLHYDAARAEYTGGESPSGGMTNLLVTPGDEGTLLVSGYGNQTGGRTLAVLPFNAKASGAAEFSVAGAELTPSGATEAVSANAGGPMTVTAAPGSYTLTFNVTGGGTFTRVSPPSSAGTKIAAGTDVVLRLSTAANASGRLQAGSLKVNDEVLGQKLPGMLQGYKLVSMAGNPAAGWECEYDISFKMPERDTAVSAITEAPSPHGEYRVELDGDIPHGSLEFTEKDESKEIEGYYFSAYEIVAVRVSPERGYRLKDNNITVIHKSVDGEEAHSSEPVISVPSDTEAGIYLFNMPDPWQEGAGGEFVFVTAEFEETPEEEAGPADLFILTAEELEAFRNAVDAGDDHAGETVRLGADIDLRGRDWTPIGDYRDMDKSFKGVFDGGGHTVTLDGRYGLFDNALGAVIENVRTAGELVAAPVENELVVFSPLVVYAHNSTIRNCINYANVTSVGGRSVYQEQGLNQSNRWDGWVDHNGTRTAGIVIQCFYDERYYSGDIARVDMGVFNCLNYGDITVAGLHYLPAGCAAGVALDAERIVECGAEGDVYAGEEGTFQLSYTLGLARSSVERSYSTGNLTTYASQGSHIYSYGSVIDCYTTGDYTNLFSGSGGTSTEVVGIAVGYPENSITNCYVMGKREAPNWHPHWTNLHTGPFTGYATNVFNCTTYPAKLSDAFTEDGLLVWQTSPALLRLGFSGGEAAVTGKTPDGDGYYRLPAGVYAYTGTALIGDAETPVSGELSLAGHKTFSLWADIAFDIPEGASVSVSRAGGEETAEPAEPGVYKLPNGAYAYTVSKTGYDTFAGTLAVAGTARTIKVAALAPIAAVTVSVTPDGGNASLTLLRDGDPVTPTGASGGVWSFNLAEGAQYAYEAGAPGYVSRSGVFTASASDPNKQIALTPAEARVTFTVEPAGAAVVVSDADGDAVAPSGTLAYTLTQGAQYTYTASAENYVTAADVPFTATEGAVINAVLERAKVRITFVTKPTATGITVTDTDSGETVPADDSDKVYLLDKGKNYDYTARTAYYQDSSGSFTADKEKSVQVALTRLTAEVTFAVEPKTAVFNFAVTLNGVTLTPAGTNAQAGERTYTLSLGQIYVYTVSNSGYSSVTREYATFGETRVPVELTPSDYNSLPKVSAAKTIDKGGVYGVQQRATGVIGINTTEPVTLVGLGVGMDTQNGNPYTQLYVNGMVENIDLTIRDLYISNSFKASDKGERYNMFDFIGTDNVLRFEGLNILDQDTNTAGFAMIHVPPGVGLTIRGVADGDRLYLYKRDQAAGIGGDRYERNGDITFGGGQVFVKGSKQGALVGAGSETGAAAGESGDISVAGGSLNLIPIARGAAIGGGAGSSASGGVDVYVRGGTLSINVDFSGSAVGGGGYDSGNDSDGGTLHYSGGSIRTFINRNAIDPNGDGDASDSLWNGITAAGVSDVAITAKKVNANGDPVYLLAFDTGMLETAAEGFAVYDGETRIYAGGRHAWGYINEDRHKSAQIGINYTIDNWVPLDDPNLYLYLTGEDHTLTVNGEDFTAVWNAETKGFALGKNVRHGVSVGSVTGSGTLSAAKDRFIAGETVTVTVTPEEGWRLAEDGLRYNGTVIEAANGVYGFIMPEADVTLTAVFEEIPADAPKYAVSVDPGITGGTVTADRDEAAEGERVTVIVSPNAGYGLAANGLKANGVAVKKDADGAYGFLMPEAEVTLTAVFEAIAIATPNGTRFQTGAAQDFVMRVEKEHSLYDAEAGVTVNGAKPPADGFDIKDGSTILTLFKAYMDTLAQGSFTVRVPFTDGATVETGFTVSDNPLWRVEVDSAVANGVLTPVPAEARAGDPIAVTVAPAEAYRLVPGSLKWDGRVINADAQGKYSFTMPAWDVTLTAEFIETAQEALPPEEGVDDEAFKEGIKGTGDIKAWVWDGKSIDITWFDPSADSYHIKTPAQLAGLAALVNGLYNREIDTVAGKASYIQVNTGLGDDDGPQGNNKSTATYHYGNYDFAGKTVYLDNDINMGEGNNYMPVGGQYLMKRNDSTTRIDASFNGVFDGRGHSVYIYADRHVSTGNYGDGSSVGLIGRLGNHDNEGARASGQTVKNVAVHGTVRANRSVGGVVGKIGKTQGGAAIENCANFAAISSTDAKGVGGIVGAAWNGGEIRNCYNAGAVNGTHPNPAGGIAGSAEIPVVNSYSHGKVTAPAGYAMGIGTNNGGAPTPENSYYLAGSAKDGGWYTGNAANNDGERTSDYMKSDEFVTDLGGAFKKDTNGINGGYPVLSWQGGTSVTAPPATETEEGQKPSVNVPSTTTVDKEKGEAVTVVDVPDKDKPINGGESARLVVNVDTGGESVGKITAEMPKEFMAQAAESKSEIEIRSEVANVLLPEKAVADLAAQGKEVAVKAEKNEEAGTYTFTVESGGKALETLDGGIKVAIPAPEADAGTVAVLVRADGTEEVIKKSSATDGKVNVPLDGSATIKIVDNAKIFNDVAEGAWYANNVKFASSHELFTGTAEGVFSPDASMTRAMLVTVLHRLENAPEAAGAAFSDVGAGKYYAEAVTWASESGIVTGMGDGSFAPGAEITREQLAAMLYRYAAALELDTAAKGDFKTFTDAKDVSAWAEEPLSWAAGAGLITGRANAVGAELAPKGTATRAEVAAILERFVEKLL
jgi:hypothetical protein